MTLLKDDIAAGLVGAGTAASIPDELLHWTIKVLVGALTGCLTAGVMSLVRKLFARKK